MEKINKKKLFEIAVTIAMEKGIIQKDTELDFELCGQVGYFYRLVSIHRELIARIKALIRRSTSTQNNILEFEDIKIFDNEHKVFRGKTRVHLGPTEYNLLKHLMENPCRVFSREQLLDSVWGHGIYVEQRTVDTHIRRLRKSLNIEGGKNFIRTIRSSGYSIDKD